MKVTWLVSIVCQQVKRMVAVMNYMIWFNGANGEEHKENWYIALRKSRKVKKQNTTFKYGCPVFEGNKSRATVITEYIHDSDFVL